MKKYTLIILIALACMLTFSTTAKAQYDFLRPVKGEIPGGYDFWVYTPTDYYYSLETTPVVMFLHGASLCSKDMNRSRRYGPLDAIVSGRQIDALVIVPQNPGGAWKPDKLNDILEWTKKNYAMDSTRVYVLGMSLGGYGTMDFAAAYPDKIAAAMALCGGCSAKDKSGLGRLPLWIIHGTGDRAVPVKQSQTVVKQLQDTNNDKRLRFDWLQGASHGALARILYMRKTYEWLFSHSTADPGRPVRPDITIDNSDLKKAYNDMKRGVPSPEIIFEKSIKDDDEY
ncbi:MAG: alpha/beta hydrolase-fold protein [Prevotella sp.]|uniref:carboxylesterase family protein n=1 Tax=Prevotella sp. TaxID=59823 RepID=UPI0025E0138A|nr:dienelactone hydrolase family protein [Prevotella sp.]MCI7119953.1 alpha/beta hydrolase-fold protein [Prevotella sp.]